MGDFILVGITFCRTVVGIVTRPYETYRRIIERASLWELACITVLFSIYCFTAKIQVVAVVLTYFVTVGLFWQVGRLLGGKGTLSGFMVGWGYTLIPTLVWFWGTSMVYVLIPPPRTTSTQGMLFSVVYLLFSATILFWKIILSYLALRFGLKQDLAKTCVACAVVLPILGYYSYWMYRLGVFRIPFI